MHSRRAFTLIELLVVIAIIGILVALGIYASSSMYVRGRNSTRKADLERIKNVLEQYNTDNRSYPKFDDKGVDKRIYSAEWQLTSTVSNCTHVDTNRLAGKYISDIPGDPKKKYSLTNRCPSTYVDQSSLYLYLSSSTSPNLDNFPTAFMLLATLEDPTSAGDKIIPANSPFVATGPVRFDFFHNPVPSSNYNISGANYAVSGGR